MDKSEVVTEVPDALKKLLKYVLRAFYTTEETLIIDLLLRNACMKEDGVMQLLKLDKKQMGVSIKRLKNDQFIKTRMKVESDSEGRTTKHNYYFIHYTGFVNVIKYKLDHVRCKLEVQERDSTRRASFKCNVCMKTYTDLEADHLINLETGIFNCMMCGAEVEEEQTAAPAKNARSLAKFNEQIEVLYDLLRACDKFKLHNTILEPAPVDVSQLGLDRKPGQPKPGERSTSTAPASDVRWSGESTKGIEFGSQSQAIDIRLGEAANENISHTKKEQPAWMSKSTVDGLNTAFLPTTNAVSTASTEGSGISTSNTDNNIMTTLLVHENKPAAATVLPHAAAAVASDKSDDSDMEDVAPVSGSAGVEMMLQDSDDEQEVMVNVGDRKVAFHEAAELVDQMTDEQREEYNKIAQSLYSDMYD